MTLILRVFQPLAAKPPADVLLDNIDMKAHSCASGGKVKAMIAKIIHINETLAVWLTKAFGTMWICYAFMVYGLLPAFAVFHPHQEAFLYWSNWVQLWSLPLILVGTNILGREAEERAKLDHEKLAKSYEEQQKTYNQIIALLKKQEEMMADMLKQDKVLEAQDIVLKEQTEILKEGISNNGNKNIK